MSERSKRPSVAVTSFGPLSSFLLLGGVAFHIFGFFLVDLGLESPLEPPEREPFAVFSSLESQADSPELIEQAWLFDSAPLFLVTDQNYAKRVNTVSRLRDESALFTAYPERLLIDEAAFGIDELEARLRAAVTREDLVGPLRGPFRGMGTGESPVVVPLRFTGVSLHIRSLTGGYQSVVSLPLSPEDLAGLPNVLWRPAVFLVHKGRHGRIGAPVTSKSSGNLDLDGLLRERLLESEVLLGMPEGYFEATISP